MAISDGEAAVRQRVAGTGGLVVAFSGGVDSTLLAAVAFQELGERALAVTARSPVYPEWMNRQAAELAGVIGIRHIWVDSVEMENPLFLANTPDRCYVCKTALFRQVWDVARQNGLGAVADGANADDRGDYRPGMRAARELGVISPLMEAGLGKAEIREISRRLKLSTADMPSSACLSSRIPFGEPITPAKLQAVNVLEELLREYGFRQVRVRHHGTLARIEVEREELPRLLEPGVREGLEAAARRAGFRYACADLAGYRTGSLNPAAAGGV